MLCYDYVKTKLSGQILHDREQKKEKYENRRQKTKTKFKKAKKTNIMH